MAAEMAAVDYWANRWENNDIPWHKDFVQPCLLQHYQKLIPRPKQESKVRIFVPLCGKSVDMIWLAQQGFQVVGLEGVESVAEAFFKESNLKFEVKTTPESPNIKYYSSLDQSQDITIFVMDIFDISTGTLGEKFDAIWDRGSLSAIGIYVDNRGRRYTDLLVSLLQPHGKIMIENHIWLEDPGPHRGPPSHVPLEVLQELFGNACDITPLDVDRSGMSFTAPPSFNRVYNLISLKPKN